MNVCMIMEIIQLNEKYIVINIIRKIVILTYPCEIKIPVIHIIKITLIEPNCACMPTTYHIRRQCHVPYLALHASIRYTL